VTVDRRDVSSVFAIVVDANGCADSLEFMLGTYEFDYTVDGPAEDDPICMPTVNVSVDDNTGADLSYMWISANGAVVSGGDTPSAEVDVTNGEDLQLIVTNNELGCMDTFPYPVSGFPGIMAEISASPSTMINAGESVDLTVTTDAVNPTYMWSNGETTPNITVMPMETTTYTVTITDENGCETEASITINVEPNLCTTFDVPTAFTPNGDGSNDELVVLSDGDLDAVDFQILDRWGNEAEM